jgi:diguanylate cyclase (GGDEF)-like protein
VEQYELVVLGLEATQTSSSLKILEDHGYRIQRVSKVEKADKILTTMMSGGQPLHGVLLELAVDQLQAVELLKWLRHNHPQPVRIVLARPDELAGLEALVNDGSVDRLLLQPCADEKLAQAIEDSVQIREIALNNARLKQKIQSLEKEVATADANLDKRVKEKAEDLIKLLYYDELTGLTSLTLLKDRLRHATQSARRDNRKVTLFLVGLDRFKYVNDSLGRETGDQVLREMSERISKCVRSSDTVSRIGGDVFGLLTTDPERVEDPGFLARRILDTVSAPLKIKEQDLFLTASVGISIFPHDAGDADLLLANAETAMRQAKLQARNQFRYYSGEFNQIAGKRLLLETELRRAISRKEFTLYYQPRVDINNQCVVGAESLLRWQHPERGIVAPIEFLSVLEETGLIQTVGYWVLQESMQALQRWRVRSLPMIRLAVNLSACQFHEKQLPDKIQQIADTAKLNLAEQRLELEITESLLMEDAASTRAMLQRLHEMGLKIAIDDFGTGYSALSYLITFPLDHLKIDKSFVDRIHVSDDAKAIVEAIISLSYSLHLNVIAEGVETREQLTALQSLGCKQFQGYLFARPMPEEEFISLMSNNCGASIATMAPEDRLLR